MTAVAAVQMASGPNVQANLLEARRLIQRAVDGGARLVVLPENFALMGMSDYDRVEAGERPGEGPMQAFLAEQARRHGIWLVGGTVPLIAPDPSRIYSACLVFDDGGRQVARYDKVHLFDVNLVDNQEQYTESATIEPGRGVTVVDTPFGRLGLAVCYDLRFPEMFRCMLDQGAELVAVPSAFTALTGRAHWEVLVRARAIENLVYMIAAAQGGYHLNGRETYGHAMLVDPWGRVMDQLAQGAGVVLGKMDRPLLDSTRRNFPSIYHRRINCESRV